jgi:hypothetical protein
LKERRNVEELIRRISAIRYQRSGSKTKQDKDNAEAQRALRFAEEEKRNPRKGLRPEGLSYREDPRKGARLRRRPLQGIASWRLLQVIACRLGNG